MVEDGGGDLFAGLKPIHCEGVSVTRKIGGDMHVIYYGREAVMSGAEVQMVKRPILYIIVPIAGIMEGRKMADIELQNPMSEADMLALAETKMQ